MVFLKAEEAAIQALVEQEGLAVLHPEFGTEPRVYYKNLQRFTRAVIGGSVATETNGLDECADGASVSVLLDGDGSLLMNLGTLATEARFAPPNLVHAGIENGIYELTGGQPTPAANRANVARLALVAGFKLAREYEDLTATESPGTKPLNAPGVQDWRKG